MTDGLHGRGQWPMSNAFTLLSSLTGNRALLCFSIVTRSAEVAGRRLGSHGCMRRKLWVFGFGSWSLGLAINCAVREHLFLRCDPPGLFCKCEGEGQKDASHDTPTITPILVYPVICKGVQFLRGRVLRPRTSGVAGLLTSVPKPNKVLVRHGR